MVLRVVKDFLSDAEAFRDRDLKFHDLLFYNSQTNHSHPSLDELCSGAAVKLAR
jgi:hypothetical protein